MTNPEPPLEPPGAPSPAAVVDTRGRPCPIPVIELAKAVRAAGVGDVIEVLSDDPASRVDIPVWARMQRQSFVSRRDVEGGGWAFRVEKTREPR